MNLFFTRQTLCPSFREASDVRLAAVALILGVGFASSTPYGVLGQEVAEVSTGPAVEDDEGRDEAFQVPLIPLEASDASPAKVARIDFSARPESRDEEGAAEEASASESFDVPFFPMVDDAGVTVREEGLGIDLRGSNEPVAARPQSAVESLGAVAVSGSGGNEMDGVPEALSKVESSTNGSAGDLAWSEGAADDKSGADAGDEPYVDERPRYDEAYEDSWVGGYYPTEEDTYYLGGDYPRSLGSRIAGGPDGRVIHAQGIFPYDDVDESFYDRNDYIFGPVERGLSFFAEHDAMMLESSRLSGSSIVLDGRFPVFTRRFEPSRAHVKAGPLYLDFQSIGAGVLYSDYSGPAEFKPGQEDGWLSYLEFRPRAYLHFTDKFFLSASANLIYLPGENKLGFNYDDFAAPSTYMMANWQGRIRDWDFMLYDRFGVYLPLTLQASLTEEALDVAGRYRFGFLDRRPSSGLNVGDSFRIGNTVGGRASRVLGSERQWRLHLSAARVDFWRNNFEDHGQRHNFGALVGYEGAALPFSPFASYQMRTSEFDQLVHRTKIGVRGRLSENVSFISTAGYGWTTGGARDRDSFLWDVALRHHISSSTTHGVRYGQDYFANDFSDDEVFAEFLSYDISHRITERLQARAYAQWSLKEEYPEDGGDTERDRDLYGGTLTYRPLDYTQLTAGAAYQDTDYENTDRERWLVFATANQKIFSRTTLWFRYQFEETDVFDEHLYMTGVRRYF